MALYSDVRVIGVGQSQLLMAATGGGETVDTPMAALGTAYTRLTALLQAYMSGVSVEVSGASNQTWVSGTALIRSYNSGSPAFWDDSGAGTLDTYGITARDYILGKAGASRLGIMMHWVHAQDAASAGWVSDADYGGKLAAFYDAIYAACAPSFGAFFILPVPSGSRPLTGNAEYNTGTIRRFMQAMAGEVPEYAGVGARSFVLRPTHTGPFVTVGAYQSSGDYTHVIRSSAWRTAGHAAVRIAGANGAAPPGIDQPRLARAVRINATTIRAWFASPARLPLHWQNRGDSFELSPGTVSAVAAPDNTAVASTGYVTMDVTCSGFNASSRLFFCRNIRQYADFANGITPPRGNLRSALWADPGGLTAITDGAEDVLLTDAAMHTAPHQIGVPVEF